MKTKKPKKEPKLLPCPFDGMRVYFVDHNNWGDYPYTRPYGIECTNDTCPCNGVGHYYSSLESAAEAWNRRAK